MLFREVLKTARKSRIPSTVFQAVLFSSSLCVASTMPEKITPLEEGLLKALRAIDAQVAREMQRTPAEREESGSQKWEPFNKRIENIAAFLIDHISEQNIQLDSLIVLSQALTKVLKIFSEDMGEDGLGRIRTTYIRWTLENLARDSSDGLRALGAEAPLT